MLALIGLLIIFWGCVKKEGPTSSSSNNNGAQTAQTTQQNANPAASPEFKPAPSVRAIATADGEKQGTRVEITELKRTSNNTLTLKFQMVNDGPDKLPFSYDFGDEANHIKDFDSIGGVNLVDSTGKKKYFVVRDTENNCLCSRDLKDINPGSRVSLWAKFPAPPDDVEKISVVIPHFGPIDDVPISR
jgi:hypothetical protein